MKSHYESLARVIEFTRSADTKAGPVIALQIALVGTLAARFDKLWVIVNGSPWDIENTLLVLLLTVYGVFLVVVVVLAARVYMPINSKTGESLIYFEDIAALEFESFEAKAKEMSISVIECQLLDQIHRVSQIARVKMRRVRWAFVMSFPSSMLWLALLVWGAVR